MNIIKVIDDETIEIRKYAKPNLVFNTNEYTNDYDYCTFKETINPFVLYGEKVELENKVNKAIKILHSMKHCELLLGGYKKSNIDKLLEILGDKENE